MSEVIDRIGAAIVRADADAVEDEIEPTSQPWARRLARAAIEAMMRPTPAMVEAGQAVDGTITAEPVWQAMLSAALHGDQEG